MGMYDNVDCKYPLPEVKPGMDFQTKDFGDGFTGGFLDSYTITKEGELIFHKTSWEVVPEEDRPYYGKPEWKNNPLMQVCGSMKSVPLGDENMEYHGTLNIYTIAANDEWFEYELKFTDGKVVDVKRIYREYGNG